MMPGVRHEVRLKIIRDLVFALHPHKSFSPARIATAIFAWRHGGDVPDAELLPACPPIPQGFRELVDADPTPPFLQDIIS